MENNIACICGIGTADESINWAYQLEVISIAVQV